MENKTRQLTAQAGRLQCAFSASLNGDSAKTAKFQIVARTSNVLECPSWATDENELGRLVHDLSGMRTNRPEIPLLWNHMGLPIGTANRYEIRDGNLIISGIIKSTEPGDLADAIISKLRAGIPFQASINFGDSTDGATEVEEYGEGEIASCNGTVYTGPLYIVRKWTCVEISCVSVGMDTHTEVKIDLPEAPDATQPGEPVQQDPAVYSFSATVRDRNVKLAKNDNSLTDTENTSFVQANNIPKSIPSDRDNTGSGTSTSSGSGEGDTRGSREEEKRVSLSTEAEPEPEVEPQGVEAESVEGEAEKQLSASMLKQYGEQYGTELAFQYFVIDGLNESQARDKYLEQLKSENEKLKQFAKQQQQSNSVDFIPSDDPGKAFISKVTELERSGMSKGAATFAARHFNK